MAAPSDLGGAEKEVIRGGEEEQQQSWAIMSGGDVQGSAVKWGMIKRFKTDSGSCMCVEGAAVE